MVYFFLALLMISLLLIIVTLASLPKLGDERKNFIKMKAQSYAFTIVIGILVLEIIGVIYSTIWKEQTYNGLNPFSFLLSISIIYLITLQFSKKKYGG